MRKAIISALLVGLWACASIADELRDETVTFTHTGTNTALAVTQTVHGVVGPIQKIHVILGTATNVDVDIVVNPKQSTEDNITLYSADDVDADKILYPVTDRHFSGGAVTTNVVVGPHIVVNDPIECIVSDWAQTAKVVRVRIVYEQKK